MIVVDSCGWLEYFADGPNAGLFAPALEDPSQLIVPSISIYEVFRRILQQRSESEALEAIAPMSQGRVVGFDAAQALIAARISLELGLPMADSIMLATARAHEAELWTQDAHLEGIEGVRYFEQS